MSLAKPLLSDFGQVRPIQRGDIVLGGELIGSLTTVGAGTLTAAILTGGIVNRTGPVGGYIDTTDSAANIINAMLGNTYVSSADMSGAIGIDAGTTFRFTFINGVAQAMTLAAGTGVTLGSNVNVAASSVKDYLITVLNGMPTQVLAANTTNASAVITGLTQAQTNDLGVGMLVTGTGIQANSTVISVQPGVGVTLSLTATATASLVTLTFGPAIRIDSLGQKAA